VLRVRVFRHDKAEGLDRGASVAIGNFDGVHPGHQAVIAQAGGIARSLHVPHAVLTFEPHPYGVFKPDAPPFRLTPLRPKARQIETLGVDLLFVIHFDLDFAKREPADFVDRVLIEGLGARHVAVGYDFVFGRGRRGDAALLKAEGARKGFAVSVVEAVASLGGAVYSSTRIRELLTQGKPREAAELLGRFWEIEGRVERGEGEARGLGVPTANVALADYLRPAAGIYAVYAGIEAGGQTDWHEGVAYLGRRATLGAGELRLEAHLFDFSGELLGRHLRVALVEYLRPDAAFAGVDALKAQLTRDLANARSALAGAGPPHG
jgi:riboflavin kinase / FMN adenylyltransferase